jgi:hypothetical protein
MNHFKMKHNKLYVFFASALTLFALVTIIYARIVIPYLISIDQIHSLDLHEWNQTAISKVQNRIYEVQNVSSGKFCVVGSDNNNPEELFYEISYKFIPGVQYIWKYEIDKQQIAQKFAKLTVKASISTWIKWAASKDFENSNFTEIYGSNFVNIIRDDLIQITTTNTTPCPIRIKNGQITKLEPM